MDAKARSKMTLSIMTEQDRKMELGSGLEHMRWNNRASHKLHIKGMHLVRAFPEDIMSGCRRVAISFTHTLTCSKFATARSTSHPLFCRQSTANWTLRRVSVHICVTSDLWGSGYRSSLVSLDRVVNQRKRTISSS
jgi:hypothetical protein